MSFCDCDEEEEEKKEKEEKKMGVGRILGLWEAQMIAGDDLNSGKWRRKGEVTFFLFFHFFHLFRQSPPKNLQIQNAAVTPTLPP